MSFVKTKVMRFLRFLNLLEPGRNILSISKVYMWAMLGLILYVMVYYPDNLFAVLGTAGGQFVATANYMYRRYVGESNVGNRPSDQPLWDTGSDGSGPGSGMDVHGISEG
jgi:hypothetical protein